jgi:glucose-1-phosphate cytidylyltransferase
MARISSAVRIGDIPVIILCGGKGTRLREETEYRPKPLVEVGERPILWHIMKGYSHFGCRNFVLCLGYRGRQIKEYFLNYDYMNNDFRLDLRSRRATVTNGRTPAEDWRIVFADTGIETPTGGRIKKVEGYVKTNVFFATYGDGVSDVRLPALLDFHLRHGKIATITGFHPRSKYGQLQTGRNGKILAFSEKPRLRDYVNGGFFVFDRRIFSYLSEHSVLEEEVFERLVREQEAVLFQHDGFWFAMDTYKDYLELNALAQRGETPWMVWRDATRRHSDG